MGFSSDDIQKLIVEMCFTSTRRTELIHLAPPIYYADIVAYNGRIYHDANASSGEKKTMHPGESSPLL